MRIAQRLYEGVDLDGETVGLITYMRTDGVALSQRGDRRRRELIGRRSTARSTCRRRRGSTSRPPRTRRRRTRRSARPTWTAARRTWRAISIRDQRRLYELIWKRTVASQMESAVLDQVAVDIAGAGRQGHAARHRLGRRVRRLPGALPGGPRRSGRGGRGRRAACRTCAKARRSTRGEVTPEQHFTQPPPRYSEASLVKKLEELGIGRPSTYASILQVLQDRNYVRLEKRRFIPEDRGRLVTAFLTSFFERYVALRLHRRARRAARRHLRRPHRLEGGAARVLAATSAAAIAGTKDLRITPGASTRSTPSSGRISSRPTTTAAIRASARPAAPAGSASSSAGSAPSSAARTIRNAATRAASASTTATASMRGRSCSATTPRPACR